MSVAFARNGPFSRAGGVPGPRRQARLRPRLASLNGPWTSPPRASPAPPVGGARTALTRPHLAPCAAWLFPAASAGDLV